MKRILVAYASPAGSTADIAQTIAKEIEGENWRVDARPFFTVENLTEYDSVVLGAPMMMGWHPGMVNFLRAHQAELTDKPVACFITALNLTDTGETHFQDVPIYKDVELAHPPHKPGKLSLKERRTSLEGYLSPIFAAVPDLRLISIAFFGGRLDLRRLKWMQILFVTFLIRARPGDYRNWDAVHGWAVSLKNSLYTNKDP